MATIAGEMHGHAADRAIHPSPGVGDAPGLVRPQQVLVQPAAAPLSHQPGEAGLLQSVADGLGGGAHTPAVLHAGWKVTAYPDARRSGVSAAKGRSPCPGTATVWHAGLAKLCWVGELPGL